MRDFNLPSIKWTNEITRSGLSLLDSMYLDCFTSLGLTQLVSYPTFFPSGNILDLILTTDADHFGDTELLPPFPNCGHSPVVTSLVLQHLDTNDNDRYTARLWHRGDYNTINTHLNSIDWDLEFA